MIPARRGPQKLVSQGGTGSRGKTLRPPHTLGLQAMLWGPTMAGVSAQDSALAPPGAHTPPTQYLLLCTSQVTGVSGSCKGMKRGSHVRPPASTASPQPGAPKSPCFLTPLPSLSCSAVVFSPHTVASLLSSSPLNQLLRPLLPTAQFHFWNPTQTSSAFPWSTGCGRAFSSLCRIHAISLQGERAHRETETS